MPYCNMYALMLSKLYSESERDLDMPKNEINGSRISDIQTNWHLFAMSCHVQFVCGSTYHRK